MEGLQFLSMGSGFGLLDEKNYLEPWKIENTNLWDLHIIFVIKKIQSATVKIGEFIINSLVGQAVEEIIFCFTSYLNCLDIQRIETEKT